MTNPFHSFDKTYCINLAERQDRWDECLSIIRDYNLNVERFDAVKPNIEGASPEENGRFGCAASYCEIIKKSIEDQLDTVLVLEDDFFFLFSPEDTFNGINNCLAELPQNWDCLYLGANLVTEYTNYPISKYSDHLFKLNSSFATHSILFSAQGLKNFAKYFSSLDKMAAELILQYRALDLFFASRFLFESNSFVCDKLFCSQRISFSNIENLWTSYTKDFLQRLEYFKTIAV